MDCDIARFDSPVPTRGRRRSVTPVRTGGFGGGGGCDTTPCAAERSTGRRRAAASLQPSATTPRRHSARRTGEAASVAAAAAPPPSPLWFAQTAGDGWAGVAAADERQVLRERRVDQSVHHHEPHWFGSVSCPAAAPEQSVCGGGGGSGRGSSSRQEHQKSVLSEFRSIQEADRAQAARMHKRRYPSHPSLAVSVGKENLPCSQRGRAAPAAAPYKPLAAPYGTSSDCPQPPSLAATPAPHAAAREGTRATPHGGVERPAERCRQMKQLSEALSTYRLRQRR
eukprot:Rhum_TRINITY_DN9484_c0_g1::Rhum_TRINITY_DN9484_c0_g1_i1::g.33679::m.33679